MPNNQLQDPQGVHHPYTEALESSWFTFLAKKYFDSAIRPVAFYPELGQNPIVGYSLLMEEGPCMASLEALRAEEFSAFPHFQRLLNDPKFHSLEDPYARIILAQGCPMREISEKEFDEFKKKSNEDNNLFEKLPALVRVKREHAEPSYYWMGYFLDKRQKINIHSISLEFNSSSTKKEIKGLRFDLPNQRIHLSKYQNPNLYSAVLKAIKDEKLKNKGMGVGESLTDYLGFFTAKIILVLVYKALLDEDAWKGSVLTQEQRLNLLQQTVSGLDLDLCTKGIGHALLSCLNGYEGEFIEPLFDKFLNHFSQQQVQAQIGNVKKEVLMKWVKHGEMPEEIFSKVDIKTIKENLLKDFEKIGLSLDNEKKTYTQQMLGAIDYMFKGDEPGLRALSCLEPTLTLLTQLRYDIFRYAEGSAHKNCAMEWQNLFKELNIHFEPNNESHSNALSQIVRLFQIFDILKNTKERELQYFGIDEKTQKNFKQMMYQLSDWASYEEKELAFFQYVLKKSAKIKEKIDDFFKNYLSAEKIKNFFANLFVDDGTISNENVYLLELLWSPQFKEQIILDDQALLTMVVKKEPLDEKKEIDLIILNQLFLQSLITPIAEWSELFTQTLEAAINCIKENRFSDSVLGQQLKKSSYANLLTRTIEALINRKHENPIKFASVLVVPAILDQATFGECLDLLLRRGSLKQEFKLSDSLCDQISQKAITFFDSFDINSQEAIEKEEIFHKSLACPSIFTALLNHHPSWRPFLVNFVMEKAPLYVVRYLLDKKAIDFTVTYNGITPLHFAVSNNKLNLLTLFLEYEPPIESIEAELPRLLGLAVEKSDTNFLTVFLDRFPNWPPSLLLNLAIVTAIKQAKAGEREPFYVVKYLLATKGMDPNLPYEEGITPLHLAATNNNLGLINLLLKYGANPESIKAELPRILGLAVKECNPKTVEYLLQAGANANLTDEIKGLLELAASAKTQVYLMLEIVKLLLDFGADPLSCPTVCDKLLFMAIRGERVDIVKLLLEKGANPNPNLSDEEEGLLSLAISLKNLAVAKLLLKHGAMPTQDDNISRMGSKLLHRAVREGDCEMVEMLLDNTSDHIVIYELNCNTLYKKKTPLQVAEQHQKAEIATLLKRLDNNSERAMQLNEKPGRQLSGPAFFSPYSPDEEPKSPPRPCSI